MVKSLHPIGEISGSIGLAGGRRVRLTRECVAIGTAQRQRDESSNDSKSPDPTALVVRAVEAPLDFPPLAAATVPGDRVAIVVDDDVPCVGDIVSGAVQVLLEVGIEIENISIVTTDAETSRLCNEVRTANGATPQFVVHDPDDENSLCLIGTTKRREPLLINRTIFDADLVLPIGTARIGCRSAYGCLYPRFSNAAANERYRSPLNHDPHERADTQAREADEAGWLVGAPMVVQVVPGAGDTVADVVAGDPHAVAGRSEQLCRARWLLHSPRQVGLVIATIGGGPRAQRWENVGRALAAAESLLGEGGAVAVCSNLAQVPGESLGRLIGSTDLERTERKILHDHGEDSWPAWQLVRALQRGPVYFLSQLDTETSEDLGLAPIADVAELVRLANRHESFVVVEDSQHAVVTVDMEDIK